ncbi:hypothetical protein, partial [uncultured Corynebacterium sp.]|uniref:hypothetical protein n=1 Tax=uncultured Corynebacterium sp. TaxID=159447 RepID=UPI0025DBA7AB
DELPGELKKASGLKVTTVSGGCSVELTTETDDRRDTASTCEALTSALDGADMLRREDAFRTGLPLGGTL